MRHATVFLLLPMYVELSTARDLTNWVLGLFLVSILWFCSPTKRDSRSRRILSPILFFPWFLLGATLEVIKGTWLMLLTVLDKRRWRYEGVVEVPLRCQTRLGSEVLSLVFTAAPGTAISSIDYERGVLEVHAADARDLDGLRADFEAFYNRYQRHVIP